LAQKFLKSFEKDLQGCYESCPSRVRDAIHEMKTPACKKSPKKEKGENKFKTFVTLLGGAHKEFNLTDYYI